MRFIKTILICLLGVSFSNGLFAQLDKNTEKVFKEKFFEAENFLISENYRQALPLYLELDSMDPKNANINWKIGLCHLNSVLIKSKSIPFLEIAVKAATENYEYDSHTERSTPVAAYRDLAHAYHLNYQLDTAIAMFKKFKSHVNEKDEEVLSDIARQIKMCRNAQELTQNPIKAIITNLGGNINGPEADFGPVITADESMLIFTSRRSGSTGSLVDDNGLFFEDIYVSYNSAGEWSGVSPIDTNINSANHEATIGVSADGQTLFIYKDDKGDGNIYSSRLEGAVWSVPSLLGSDINTKAWETHAVINAEGNTIYFVSDREGGIGGRDLYQAVKLPNGEWSLAKNMGTQINTPFDEDAPFIHPDGRQLYFSSNGHKSMGGFDIFSSELSEENKWSRPVNIGYPINTTDDDIFYITSTDGKRAYYSSAKPGGFGEKDIYMISLPEAEEKNLTVLTGVVADQFGNVPGFAEIIVTDNESGELMGIYNPNTKTGKYLIILPKGRNYNISYEADGHLHHSENFLVPDNSSYAEISRPIELETIRVGGTIVLNNIFFEFNKTTIKKESTPELDRLYKLMSNMKNLVIEISGHTDSKGGHDLNMELSQGRAEAIVEVLVKRGIEKERMVAKGYGETKPVANNLDSEGNEDEEGMALNRRVELKILDL